MHSRLLLAVAVTQFFVSGLPFCAAQGLPTPGSTYHLLFATSNRFRITIFSVVPPGGIDFGNIQGADWQVTVAAFDASLPRMVPGLQGWDGYERIYRAILSISGDNAKSRLSVSGPVYNLHGELLASDLADMFDGGLNPQSSGVGFDEYGNAIVANSEVWTGSGPGGTWAAFSCGTWNVTTSASTGRIGNAGSPTGNWLDTGANRGCNVTARLYGLSPALTAPLWGDYDGSGTVDDADLLEWQTYNGAAPFTYGGTAPAAFYAARSYLDGNLSKAIGDHDLAVWEQFYGQSIFAAGDYTEDGVVDGSDYDLWQTTYGSTVPRYNGADGNGDGVVDAADYTLWRDAFSQAPSTAVPEPGAIAIAILALAGIGGRRTPSTRLSRGR